MKVNFDKVLCCDLSKVTFENKNYYQMIVYSEGQLHRISIDVKLCDIVNSCIGSFVKFSADLKTYDGKNKFKLVTDIELV